MASKIGNFLLPPVCHVPEWNPPSSYIPRTTGTQIQYPAANKSFPLPRLHYLPIFWTGELSPTGPLMPRSPPSLIRVSGAAKAPKQSTCSWREACQGCIRVIFMEPGGVWGHQTPPPRCTSGPNPYSEFPLNSSRFLGGDGAHPWAPTVGLG